MIGGLIAKRYADALFEVAKENQMLDQVEQDLALFIEVMNETEGLLSFLRHPQLDGEVKKEVIGSNLGESITWVTQNFIFQLIDAQRVEYVEDMLQYYIKLANEERGIINIDAISANTLSEEDKQNIIDSFKKQLGKEIRLENKVDPSIIGGLIVKVGDRVYDGSLKRQLEDLKKNLVASRV